MKLLSFGKSIDMTKGNLFKKILLFSIPVVIASVLQELFAVADSIVVSNFEGEDSFTAVSSNGTIINMCITFFIGISIGANVVMAQFVGANDYERQNKVLHSSMLLALIFGLFLGLMGFFFAGTFIKTLHLDNSVFDKAKLYLSVYFLGSPAVMLYNFGSAIIKARGDSVKPLIYLFTSGIINVGLNLIFVIVLKLDVLGVALATVISQSISAILVIICLFREKDFCKLKIKELKISKSETKEVLKCGIPSGVQGACFGISNIIIQAAINSLGKSATSGNSAAAYIGDFIYIIMNSMYIASITAISQNYGAKDYKRINSTLKVSTLITTVYGLFFGGLALLFSNSLISIFITDTVSVNYAKARLYAVVPFYFLCGIQEVGSGALRGIGYSFRAMMVSLIGTCVLRLIWVYTVFALTKDVMLLFFSYPLSWLINTLGYYISFYKLLGKETKLKEELKEKTVE